MNEVDWIGNLFLLAPRRYEDGEGVVMRRAMIGAVWMAVGGVLMLLIIVAVVMRIIWRHCKML